MELLLNKEWYEEVQRHLSLPPFDQRFLFFSYAISRDNHIITKKETDTHVYMSLTTVTLKFNNALYTRHKNKEGLTWDKEKKKLKIWFGKQYYGLDHILQERILISFDVQWVADLCWSVRNLISNTVLQKIIAGTITTEEQIINAYMRTIGMGKHTFDPYQVRIASDQVAGSIRGLKPYLQYCTDPVKFIEHFSCNYMTQNMKNLATYAEKFNEKFSIDYTDEELEKILENYRKRVKQYSIEKQLNEILWLL